MKTSSFGSVSVRASDSDNDNDDEDDTDVSDGIKSPSSSSVMRRARDAILSMFSKQGNLHNDTPY